MTWFYFQSSRIDRQISCPVIDITLQPVVEMLIFSHSKVPVWLEIIEITMVIAFVAFS